MKPTLADLDALADRFRRIAFVTEHGPHFPYIVKWRGHVPVYVNASDALYREAEQVAWRLRQITGIDVFPQRVSGPPDVTKPHIYLEEGAKSDFSACFVRYSGRNAELSVVKIGIGPHSRASQRRCVNEELAQAMGLRNDHPGWPDSLFNDQNTRDETLSWADAILLRTLYDQRLLIGMPREEAMPIARQIISEILTEIDEKTAGTR